VQAAYHPGKEDRMPRSGSPDIIPAEASSRIQDIAWLMCLDKEFTLFYSDCGNAVSADVFKSVVTCST
jgi:hypothetical protein